jgi:hypothetical protein
MSKLERAAEYHFKNIPTRCKFLHIYTFEIHDKGVLFTALFKCKRRIVTKRLVLDYKGNIVS